MWYKSLLTTSLTSSRCAANGLLEVSGLTWTQRVLVNWNGTKPYWEWTEEIDVAIIADILVTLFRYLADDEVIPFFKLSLEPERSDAVKICTVKACITIIEDVCALTLGCHTPSYELLSGVKVPMAATAPKAHGRIEREIRERPDCQSL